MSTTGEAQNRDVRQTVSGKPVRAAPLVEDSGPRDVLDSPDAAYPDSARYCEWTPGVLSMGSCPYCVRSTSLHRDRPQRTGHDAAAGARLISSAGTTVTLEEGWLTPEVGARGQ